MGSILDRAERGSDKVKSGEPASNGQWFGMTVTQEIVVTSATFIEPEKYSAADMIDGETFPPGVYPWLRLSSLTVASGVCYLHRV